MAMEQDQNRNLKQENEQNWDALDAIADGVPTSQQASSMVADKSTRNILKKIQQSHHIPATQKTIQRDVDSLNAVGVHQKPSHVQPKILQKITEDRKKQQQFSSDMIASHLRSKFEGQEQDTSVLSPQHTSEQHQSAIVDKTNIVDENRDQALKDLLQYQKNDHKPNQKQNILNHDSAAKDDQELLQKMESHDMLQPQKPPTKPKKQGFFSRLFGKKNTEKSPKKANNKNNKNLSPSSLDSSKDNAEQLEDVQVPQQEDKWQIQPSYRTKDDPLLGCLMIICKLLDRSTTEEALTAELPIGDSLMTPELFVRAAERELISAKLINRKLSRISPLTLPCVILLKGRLAGVLVDIKHGKNATIIMPDSHEGEQIIPWKELKENYSGYSIFARPKFRYDKRATEHQLIKKPKGWFWGTVFNLWPIYTEVIVASFLINILMIIGPLFMMNVYDRVIPHFAFETLWVLAAGVGILLVFQFALMIIRAYMLELAGKAIHTRISARLFQQLMGLKMKERGNSTGTMAEKLNGLDSVRQFFGSQTAIALIDFPFCGMFLVIIFVLSGPIALVPTSIIIFLLLAAFFSAPISRKFARERQEEKQHGRGIMVETIYGMETIKSTGAESRLQRDWELFSEQTSTTQMRSGNANQIVMSLMMSSMQLNMVLVAVFGVYMIQAGSLTMGGLLAANMLSMRAISPMMRVAGVAMRVQQSFTSLKQINEIMNKNVERPIGSNFVHRDKFKGSVEFKNVTFTYPGQETKALDNVSFKIEPGEKVGVIGRIGSGKSTIERLILGLYEVDDGAVLIDGIDTRQIDPAELRRNVGTVPQDVFLFYGTLRENIVMHAPYADDDMVLRAAHIAGVDEFVARHPQGMDLEVGEKGQNLSGGQRQAVSIARAFLIDPPIMLLDEPTAAMDTTSENRFKARLDHLMGDRTLILMTHRFSLLSVIDRLLVVDNSKIVADGPKDRVLEALRNGTIQSVDV